MSAWVTCQLGAREHYAIPRALLRNGALQRLCTDIWAGPVIRRLGHIAGRRGRAISARHHPGIPTTLVRHWTAEAVARELHGASKKEAPYDRFIGQGIWFAGQVREWLSRESSLPHTLFSYDTTALEIFEWAKPQGIRLVLGQMDPGRVEAELVAKERALWSGWQPDAGAVPESYHARRTAEWELADTIVVNSQWSRDALVRQDVPPQKIMVTPLVYESPSGTPPARRKSTGDRPLELLFLGQVNLRKGIPYLLEAARLAGKAVELSIVGSIQISDAAVCSAPSNVRFIGPVSRDEVVDHYQRADAFVLPTLSDGFAITQLEAMAHGLPVIATSNCGEVVSDGVDGFIVPARDPRALAETILTLHDNRPLLERMSAAAIRKSSTFTIECLSERLSEL